MWQYIEWLAIIFSSLILSPLIHFGLYFCLLHSPKHLQDVGVELGVSIKRAVIISLPFVILTIILGAVMYEFFGSDKLSNDLLRWIFIGLFGLTVSHMVLIHLWHGSDCRHAFRNVMPFMLEYFWKPSCKNVGAIF